MARTRRDKHQAKLIEQKMRTYTKDAYFYRPGLDRYKQQTRNNHYLPEHLAANSRLSSISGDWGVIVSSRGCRTAYDMGYAFAYLGLFPDNVRKVACFGPDYLCYGEDGSFAELAQAGAVLLFDDTGTFNDVEPMIDSELIRYGTDVRTYYRQSDITWLGDVPQEYADEAELASKKDGYDKAAKELTDALKEQGLNFYDIKRSFDAIDALSFGFYDTAGLRIQWNDVETGYWSRNRINGAPCSFEYDPVPEEIHYEKAMESFGTALNIARIWHAVLSRRYAKLDLHLADFSKPECIEGIRSLGRDLGVEPLVKLGVEGNIDIEDLIA